jgi:pyridoxamine 5'-phosphate oxidase
MSDPASATDSIDTTDPIAAVCAWHAAAQEHPAVRYPHSACLATQDADGPDARIVLIHTFGPRYFVFGTDLRSAKAQQLARCSDAALVLYWEPLERQVRMRGRVEMGSAAEADLTFDDRPRESRIIAWVSHQGQSVSSPAALATRWREAAEHFAGTDVVPRPSTWCAYRFEPNQIELWQARRHRLHHRTRYTHTADGHWRATVLEP